MRPWGWLEGGYLVEGPGRLQKEAASRGRPLGPPGRRLLGQVLGEDSHSLWRDGDAEALA